MNNRLYYIVIVLIITGFIGIAVTKPRPKHTDALVGVVDHKSQGEKHIGQGAPHAAYNSELPSSGPHYQDASAPAAWGIYIQELPPEVFLHNEEHGGIVVTYKPNLPSGEVKQLQKLFYGSLDKNFSAGKYILMPRAANKQPIELASWTRTFSLHNFDQSKIETFYSTNASNKRAPEPFAGPFNKPINEAGVY